MTCLLSAYFLLGRPKYSPQNGSVILQEVASTPTQPQADQNLITLTLPLSQKAQQAMVVQEIIIAPMQPIPQIRPRQASKCYWLDLTWLDVTKNFAWLDLA